MRLFKFDPSAVSAQVSQYDQEDIRPEATLESWLHANPSLILDEPLLIIGRQVRLDAGVVDLVTVDQFGNVVVVEVKIGRSGTGSASEETILSQPQVYASALSSFDYTELNELYQDYCSRLDASEWDVEPSVAVGGTLQSAVQDTFGKDLDEQEFNTEQRLVVVAEKITQRTAANARYLLESGIHFQCTEVGWFSPPDGTSENTILTSSTVVDYDVSRVRPPRRESPTYPDLVEEIVDRIFPEIREVVHADAPIEVFPEGFDSRGPALVSRHPDHPGGVIYYLSPEPDNDRVAIGLHNMNEIPEVREMVQHEKDRFEKVGLTVKDNQRYNLLWRRWSVESAEDVRKISEEIGEQYKTMIQLGHEVLAKPHAESA